MHVQRSMLKERFGLDFVISVRPENGKSDLSRY